MVEKEPVDIVECEREVLRGGKKLEELPPFLQVVVLWLMTNTSYPDKR